MKIEHIPIELLVPHYLVHCAAYYVYNASLVTDNEFDTLSKRVYDAWDCIEHRHKTLIDRTALRTTGAYLVNKLPGIVLSAAEQFILEGAPKVAKMSFDPLELLR
jgi:hypothetical protein